MAKFNEILTGRLNRAMQKFTGIKASAPTPQLATEFIPVFPIFWGVENRYLEQWNRYGMFANCPANAGQQNGVRFLNQSLNQSTPPPASTNVMIVVEKITVANNGAAAMQWFLNYYTAATVGVSGVATVQNLDIRAGIQLTSTALVTFGNVISFGNAIGGGVLPANTSTDYILYENQEITLPPPNTGLAVWTNVVNVPMQITLIWRERALEESER